MTPTEVLRHEHQIILLVLDGVERGAARLPARLEQEPEWLGTLVDFFRTFVDRCHHSKEERHLFPRLEARGVPREGGPIAVMLWEHEEGRALVRAVAEAEPEVKGGNAVARDVAKAALIEYVDLLRSHIAKENDVLFVRADQVLTAEDQVELEAAFERVEAEEMGEGTHERYHELAHRLAEQ